MAERNEMITSDEISVRAEWFAWRYDLDPEQVKQVLSRLVAIPERHVMDDFFTYYQWNPSLENALSLTRPAVVMRAFGSAELDELREWQELTQRIFGEFSEPNRSIEELCRWDAEQHLLID